MGGGGGIWRPIHTSENRKIVCDMIFKHEVKLDHCRTSFEMPHPELQALPHFGVKIVCIVVFSRYHNKAQEFRAGRFEKTMQTHIRSALKGLVSTCNACHFTYVSGLCECYRILDCFSQTMTVTNQLLRAHKAESGSA